VSAGGQSRPHAAPLSTDQRGQEGWWLLEKVVANKVLTALVAVLGSPMLLCPRSVDSSPGML